MKLICAKNSVDIGMEANFLHLDRHLNCFPCLSQNQSFRWKCCQILEIYF